MQPLNQPKPKEKRGMVFIAIACIAAGMVALLGTVCGVYGSMMISPESGYFWFGVFGIAVAVVCAILTYVIVRYGVLRK